MSTTPVRTSRIASLDLLRLIAALAVVGFHYCFAGPLSTGVLDVAYPEVQPFAIFGYLGVNLFFLISGYVIAWSADGRDAVAFTFARFARLWPGHVAAMTLTFAVMAAASAPAFPVSITQYAANLTMLAPAFGQPFMDGAYWSIVLELVFYFWIATALLAGLFRHKLELVAGWLLLALVNETVLDSGALRMLFLTEYAGFFAGGIIAYDARKHGWSMEAALLAIAAFLFATVTLFSGRAWMLDHYGLALTPAALVASSVVLHGVFLGALALRLPESRAIAFAGALTYPLYLLHQHIGYVLIERLEPLVGRWPAAGLTLVLVVAAAALIVVLAERPAQRWLKPRLARLADAARRLAPAALMRGTG